MELVIKAFDPVRVDALDIDPAMIRLAARRKSARDIRSILYLVADAQYLPYPDGCMDAVFNYGILHHLEDWRLGITEIARVLRPGGGFYFEEIYPPLYANFFLHRLLTHPRENRFHGPEYRAAMADAGLKLLQGYKETRFGILGVAEKKGSVKGWTFLHR